MTKGGGGPDEGTEAAGPGRGANVAGVSAETEGRKAERLVFDRLRSALPERVVILTNVRWIARDRGHEIEGEADLVIADPDRGFLVVEVKAGEISRDGHGRWWAGKHPLDRSPFQQASSSHHNLVKKLRELPAWESGLNPTAGHGVAFPGVDLETAAGRLGLAALGPEADPDLILDQPRLLPGDGPAADLRAWLDHAFEVWYREGGGTGSGTRPPGEQGVAILRDLVTSPVELHSMLRNELVEGEREVVRLTAGQIGTLNTLRGVRRASIVGGAGTGKTMLAVEKARRLAREGFRTLLVCFNSPLARMLAEETQEVAAATGLLTVSTFHQLCEDLGRDAGTLPPKPANPLPPSWFNETLPDALEAAIERDGGRFHAIVVDEGQDFEDRWLLALDELLETPQQDVVYVFHDPAQAIYRDDAVADLGLQEYPLDTNCRNAQPIHDVIRRFAGEGLSSLALHEGGRPPEMIEAKTDAETIEALRRLLHRLRVDEGVLPWDIAVLSGSSLEESAVWRQRTYGNEVLWNGQVDDAGRTLGLASNLVPASPDDAILCDSIRRFKGLERPVIVLVELKPDDRRLDQMLYVGASRARQHLAVIGSAAVLERLQ